MTMDNPVINNLATLTSVIESSVFVVPKDGALVLSLPTTVTDKDIARIRKDVGEFFAGRKVLVLRSGDVKIGCITWEG